MPIYEYECKDCGHKFETIRKISAGPPDACPSCGEDKLQKLVSKAAFRLKGTGWYETDFKNKSDDKKTDSSGDSSAKSSTGDAKKDDKSSSSASTKEAKPAKTATKSDD